MNSDRRALGVIGFAKGLFPLLPARTRTRLCLVAATSIGLGILEAAGLALVLPLLQSLSQNTASSTAVILGLGALVAFLAKAGTALLTLKWSLGVVLDAEAHAAARLLDSYLRADYQSHLDVRPSDLIRNVTDSTRRTFQEGLAGFLSAASDAVVIAAIALVLLAIEPVVAIFAFGYFILVACGYQSFIHGRVSMAGRSAQNEASRSVHVVQQSVTSIKEVQLYGIASVFVERLLESKRQLCKANRTLLVAAQLPRYYLEVALVLGAAVLAAGSMLWLPEERAIAVLGLFLAAALRVLPSINRVIVGLNMVRSAIPAFADIQPDLGARGVGTDEGPGRSIPQGGSVGGAPSVEFQGVWFSYKGDRGSVLEDISIQVAAGSSAALIGPSGAGKSTILDLLLGFLRPCEGRILIGELEPDGSQPHLRSIAAYVPQEIALLNASIRENIALGQPRHLVDDEALNIAVEASALVDVMTALPDGLDTAVGERGVMLSGGERQRLGLARALYRRPKLLVLDEATSSLDIATERRVIRSLEALSEPLTLVMVTHRLHTAANCEVVHVVERGRIILSGPADIIGRPAADGVGLSDAERERG